MRIAELIQGLPVEIVRGPDSTDVSGIVEDSRCAGRGCLFVARPGTRLDGRAYVADALAAGAAAVLSDRDLDLPAGRTLLVAADVRAVIGPLAERLAGNPASVLGLVGVTGTNGKTTVCHLVRHLLAAAGRRCGLIGTVEIDDGRTVRASAMTTPAAPQISRLLRDMAGNGCDSAVLEVSSHALDQGRVGGLDFDVAVFTNLSGDHLDYHASIDDYAAAKAKLFESLRPDARAVVNADDPLAAVMTRRCRARVLTCSLRDPAADCYAFVRRQTVTATSAVLEGPWGSMVLDLPLVGRHNVLNVIEAAAAANSLGATSDVMAAALAACRAPAGRLEHVPAPGGGAVGAPSVLVDYAHTDDALDNVLHSLRDLIGEPRSRRLIVVFGCGGDRDRSKRPRMGRVAARWADALYVTSDNPRTEDPRAIIDEVVAGIPAERLADTTTIVCRREAIRRAIAGCGPGDVVLIAGKGHEDYQIIGEERRPFDDRLVAAEALARPGSAA